MKSSSKPTVQFYRRALPDSCVDFSSEQGKQLFIQALNEGNANIYFKLAAQFLTQEEPSFCGLSTLVMVLNALEVDPARVWKGAWRWYHESMLDCCIPLEIVLNSGITADQFHCLALCNRLTVARYNPPPSFPTTNMDTATTTMTTISEDEKARLIQDFRNHILQTVGSDSQILVVSYCRRTLGQTGLGHFSPLAAFNQAKDSVLIMDVARFKYPPHWVSVPLLWEAMRDIDNATGKPRCYFVMSLNENLRPLLLLRLVDGCLKTEGVVEEIENGLFANDDDQSSSLSKPLEPPKELALSVLERISNVLTKFNILDIRDDYNNVNSTTTTTTTSTNIEEDQQQEQKQQVSKFCCPGRAGVIQGQVKMLIQELIGAFESTEEYKFLTTDQKLEENSGGGGDNDDKGQRIRALLAVGLFLSWPFDEMKRQNAEEQQKCSILIEYRRVVVDKLPASARNEVNVLKRQILAMIRT